MFATWVSSHVALVVGGICASAAIAGLLALVAYMLYALCYGAYLHGQTPTPEERDEIMEAMRKEKERGEQNG